MFVDPPLGSPPRARGEGADKLDAVDREGITPACAGRRDSDAYEVEDVEDHPRVRGEKADQGHQPPHRRGSPPRARGEGHMFAAAIGTTRITPACAGRSRYRTSRSARCSDHPRVRGEKSEAVPRRAKRVGSPPRARGEVFLTLKVEKHQRITPACAGRSPREPQQDFRQKDHPRVRGEKTPAAPPHAARPDHPRVRGEKSQRTSSGFFVMGSPPRARGEVAAVNGAQHGKGITPACAGRSHPSGGRCSPEKDHPRVRGEKKVWDEDSCMLVGSPPRARGEEDNTWENGIERGITPACAGRSRDEDQCRPGGEDHPRVRGEKYNDRVSLRDTLGSPPRARGEVLISDHPARNVGITPACAGRSSAAFTKGPMVSDHPRVRGEKTKKIPNISRFYPGAACFSFSFS